MLQTITNTPQLRPYEILSAMFSSPEGGRVTGLKAGDTQDFLSIRPVHTVVITGFITDNGIVSELNRGKFYGYCNAARRAQPIRQ